MAFLKNTFLIKKISNHTPVLLSAHRPSPALQGRKPDAADSEWGEWGHLELRPGASQREEAAPAAAAPQPPLLRRELHRSAPLSPQEALHSVPLLRDQARPLGGLPANFPLRPRQQRPAPWGVLPDPNQGTEEEN